MHQREFERHSYVSTAQLLVGSRAVPCEVSDISLGGAMIRLASPLKQGAEVTLNMDPYGKVVGTAVWNREGLSGIKFTDSAELVGEILAAMASYSGA
ncbi:MAG: PilZ domain-containing protein [Rhodospirillales bacterium]|nr:PilZ domain-containing protein [Rhodospirillales bacterium]